jgi:hypothetical protein
MDVPGGRAGQVGVKFPGMVRDQLAHDAMQWWNWGRSAWEDFEIEFDLTAEACEDTVLVWHDGELLPDTVVSPADLDNEGNKQMIVPPDVGAEPWLWPDGQYLHIGARNGTNMFFQGFIDEFRIEAFDDGELAEVPEPSGLALLLAAGACGVALGGITRGWKVRRCLVLLAALLAIASQQAMAGPLMISTFEMDVTPPLGSPLCDALVKPAAQIVDRLIARGVVLFTDEKPIVICSLDWIGVGNGGYEEFRRTLAAAAGTTPERVALHAIHQHDAPGCDFEAEMILAEAGISGAEFNPNFARFAINRTAAALEASLSEKRTVTHIGLGTGIVEQVASNRRILGPDGRVERGRMSSCTDPIAIAAPEGTIDPKLQLVSFFSGEQPLVSMTHYATHPQSYYGQGGVSYDFPGMARAQREAALPEVAHIHFNGAGGNVAAGKYNTGAPENRPVLAGRLAEGMEEAWDNQTLIPIDGDDVRWSFEPVVLPPRESLNEQDLLNKVYNAALSERDRVEAARTLAFLRRMVSGQAINLNVLDLGPASIVYMPGELFVEYQLAAQAMAPDRFVAMAAYGDYGPGYIGTEIAYWEGGYETGPASLTAPSVEGVLVQALETLLVDEPLPGDANRDGVVNDIDASIVGAHWMSSGADWMSGDFNFDGLVNDMDAVILAAHWQQSLGCSPSVPEPSGWAMLLALALAGVGLLRRRIADAVVGRRLGRGRT